jgi:hypothetical protein
LAAVIESFLSETRVNPSFESVSSLCPSASLVNEIHEQFQQILSRDEIQSWQRRSMRIRERMLQVERSQSSNDLFFRWNPLDESLVHSAIAASIFAFRRIFQCFRCINNLEMDRSAVALHFQFLSTSFFPL